MVPEHRRPAYVYGALLATVVAIFALGGYGLHAYVVRSFVDIERVATAERLSAGALSAQLDLETGVRGYVNTGRRDFLEPYYANLNDITRRFAALRVALTRVGLPAYVANVDDAERASDEWLRLVAPYVATSRPRELLERAGDASVTRGKRLLDRFRVDLEPIERALLARRSAYADSARESVDRIAVFVTSVVVVGGLLGYAFVLAQLRLARRLDIARLAREEERRRSDALQAALAAEKRVAGKLQDALSQRPLPNLPTVHFSAMYMPASEEAKVGGDWYDAIELSPSQALFVIGDVAGHGLDAAVGMSRARQGFIGSALGRAEPAEILRRVNAELVREGSPMVTGVCGLADAQKYQFTFAVAGHPPPVLLEPGRPPRLMACGGLPLGVVDSAEYTTDTIQTVPGALLVLYTDGAIEHSHSVLEGEQLLLEAAAASRDRPDVDPATAIHRAIFDGRPAGDDVAILTIGFARESGAGVTISVERLQNSFSGHLRQPTPGETPPAAPAPSAHDGWAT